MNLLIRKISEFVVTDFVVPLVLRQVRCFPFPSNSSHWISVGALRIFFKVSKQLNLRSRYHHHEVLRLKCNQQVNHQYPKKNCSISPLLATCVLPIPYLTISKSHHPSSLGSSSYASQQFQFSSVSHQLQKENAENIEGCYVATLPKCYLSLDSTPNLEEHGVQPQPSKQTIFPSATNKKIAIRFLEASSSSGCKEWTANRREAENTVEIFGYPQRKFNEEARNSFHPRLEDTLVNLLGNDKATLLKDVNSNDRDHEIINEIRRILRSYLIDWTKINNAMIRELIEVVKTRYARPVSQPCCTCCSSNNGSNVESEENCKMRVDQPVQKTTNTSVINVPERIIQRPVPNIVPTIDLDQSTIQTSHKK